MQMLGGSGQLGEGTQLGWAFVMWELLVQVLRKPFNCCSHFLWYFQRRRETQYLVHSTCISKEGKGFLQEDSHIYFTTFTKFQLTNKIMVNPFQLNSVITIHVKQVY